MEIGLFIGLNIVSIIALTAMYFITKEVIRVTPSHRSSIIWLNSFVLGTIFLLLQSFLYYQTDQLAYLSIGLVEFALFAILLDKRMLYGALPFMIGAVFVGVTNTTFTPYILVDLIPVIIIFAIVAFFKNVNVIKNNGLRVFIVAFITILSIISVDMINNYTDSATTDYWIMVSTQLIYLIIVFGLQYGLLYLVDKFFDKFLSLESSTVADQSGIVKAAKIEEIFNYKVDEERITKGLFYIFEFEKDENIHKMHNNLTEKIKNILVFQLKERQYGVFVPYQINESLKTFEKKTNNILKEVSLSISNFKAAYAIFGVTSSSFTKLMSFASRTMPNTFDNKIHRFDHQQQKEHSISKSESAKLFEYIDSAIVKHKISPNTKEIIAYTEYFLNDKDLKIQIKDLDDSERIKIWTNLSLISLKQLKEDKNINYDSFTFNYNLNRFNERHSIEEFIKKIKTYSNKQPIISLMPEDVEFNDDTLLRISELRKRGIKFSADHLEDWELTNLKKLRPEYVQTNFKRSFSHPGNPFNRLTEKTDKITWRIGEIG